MRASETDVNFVQCFKGFIVKWNNNQKISITPRNETHLQVNLSVRQQGWQNEHKIGQAGIAHAIFAVLTAARDQRRHPFGSRRTMASTQD